jgi:hypothetical protein
MTPRELGGWLSNKMGRVGWPDEGLPGLPTESGVEAGISPQITERVSAIVRQWRSPFARMGEILR